MTSTGAAPIRIAIEGRTKSTSVVRREAMAKANITSSVATEGGRRMDTISMDAVPTQTATEAGVAPTCAKTSS
jgi:hypothetical protein